MQIIGIIIGISWETTNPQFGNSFMGVFPWWDFGYVLFSNGYSAGNSFRKLLVQFWPGGIFELDCLDYNGDKVRSTSRQPEVVVTLMLF